MTNMTALERDLANIVGIHASSVSGREFQQAALRIAQAYFPPSDLDELCRPQDFVAALAKELSGLAGDPVEM